MQRKQSGRVLLGVLLVWSLGSGLAWGQHDAVAQGHEAEASAETTATEHGPTSQGEVAPAHGASILNVDPGLMVWTVITFVALLVVLRFTAWKPLIGALEAREMRIREAVEQAEKARLEAERLLEAHRGRLEAAAAEAHQIIEEGRADALRVQKEINERAREEAEEFKERARREVELAADQAKKELWEETARLSTLLAEKILERNLNVQDQKRLRDQFLDEFGSAPSGARD